MILLQGLEKIIELNLAKDTPDDLSKYLFAETRLDKGRLGELMGTGYVFFLMLY